MMAPNFFLQLGPDFFKGLSFFSERDLLGPVLVSIWKWIT